jgi:hypothetical protein
MTELGYRHGQNVRYDYHNSKETRKSLKLWRTSSFKIKWT